MHSKHVHRGAGAVFAGFVVGAITGGALFGATRKALKGVALAALAVTGGTTTGVLTAGGVYVMSGRSSRSRALPKESHFSLPGEELPLPEGSLQEQLRGATLELVGRTSLGDGSGRFRQLYCDEVSFLAGPTGFLLVRSPLDRDKPASFYCLSELATPALVNPPASFSPGTADGGLIPVRGSRHCELACCDGEAVVIYNFETGHKQQFHLPADLTRGRGRIISRSPSGEYWICARYADSSNDYHYAQLSPDGTALHRANFRTGSMAVNRGRITFLHDNFFGTEQQPEVLLIGDQADGRAIYFQRASEKRGAEVYRCDRQSAVVAGMTIRGCRGGFSVDSLTGMNQLLPMDMNFFEAKLVETTKGALAVAWTDDGRVRVIHTTKSLDEAGDELATGLDLAAIDRVEALYDGRILAFRGGKTCHLVDRESGEVLTTLDLPTETCELFDTAWGVYAADRHNYGVVVYRLEPRQS